MRAPARTPGLKNCQCGHRLSKKYLGCLVGSIIDTGFCASTGHLADNIVVELNVPIGCPLGTTIHAGFGIST